MHLEASVHDRGTSIAAPPTESILVEEKILNTIASF